MADSGGFEPPTARFVAEYSIQLSYESVADHLNAVAFMRPLALLDQITAG